MKNLYEDVAHASAIMKLFTGVGNNAAWLVCLDALDHAKKCAAYKREVKHAFVLCLKQFKLYENALLYATENRLFHVADFAPHVREKYGDISDREFYDFWAGMGSAAYTRSKPFLSSLWNKYRLSLEAHGVKDAKHVAWVQVAMCCLELAIKLYEQGIQDISSMYDTITPTIANRAFRRLRIDNVRDAWRKALLMLSPDSEGYDLEPMEERNIMLGIQQLHECWMKPDTLMNSTIDTVEEYAEVFKDKKTHKSAIRNLKKVRT